MVQRVMAATGTADDRSNRVLTASGDKDLLIGHQEVSMR